MKRPGSVAVMLLLAAAALLASCASPEAPAEPSATSTPDPCASENIRDTAGAVNSLMQQFDDESALASSVPRSQLATRIAALQGIRRLAQEQATPGCVAQLRQLQLKHMNTVIDTMLVFISRGDQASVVQGIQAGRAQHDQYVAELAGLLGMTAAAVTPRSTDSASPSPQETPSADEQGALVAATFIAVNPGPVPITLRALPATAAEELGTLPVAASAPALGGSADGQWIQVVVPGHPYQTAWVLASLVQIVVPTQPAP